MRARGGMVMKEESASPSTWEQVQMGVRRAGATAFMGKSPVSRAVKPTRGLSERSGGLAW